MNELCSFIEIVLNKEKIKQYNKQYNSKNIEKIKVPTK